MKTTLLLMARHAESSFNGENRIQGHLDSKLTTRGKRQAYFLARRLERMGIERIYSSDLGRAMSTTERIARRLALPVRAEPRLREIHLGKWEGLTPDEVNARFRGGYDQWRRAPSRIKIPGGETVREFHARVRGIFERILKENAGRKVLVVTHGGVISSLLSHWMKADFDRVLLNLRMDNTGLTLVEASRGEIVLHAVNDVSHLQGERLNGPQHR